MTPDCAPQRRALGHGRWHFQHGPIDLIISADGESAALEHAFASCWLRFQSVLATLVGELVGLRSSYRPAASVSFAGPVAQRMARAVAPLSHRFITPMAAVAGAVADELIGCFERQGVRRAAINNGGDIALFLAPDQSFEIAVLQLPGCAAAPTVRVRVDDNLPIRGIATSGWRGRSFSLGIADSVTVLAATAASADAAATMIANAVDLPYPLIKRRPAAELKDDCDLGQRLVTVDVPPLSQPQKRRALGAGASYATTLIDAGLIHAAALTLQGETVQCCSAHVEPARLFPLTTSTTLNEDALEHPLGRLQRRSLAAVAG